MEATLVLLEVTGNFRGVLHLLAMEIVVASPCIDHIEHRSSHQWRQAGGMARRLFQFLPVAVIEHSTQKQPEEERLISVTAHH